MKKQMVSVAAAALIMLIVLGGCGQTKSKEIANTKHESSSVTETTEENTTEALKEDTQETKEAAEAKKTESGTIILDNDYITVVYQELVLYTKLQTHKDGIPAFLVTVKNKADKPIAVKPGKIVIDGNDGNGNTFTSIENVSGDFSSQGLILNEGQEVDVHIGITKMNGKDYSLDDIKNVDFIIRAGDTDMEKMTNNILSEDWIHID